MRSSNTENKEMKTEKNKIQIPEVELLLEHREEPAYIDFSVGKGKITRAKEELSRELRKKKRYEELKAVDKDKAEEMKRRDEVRKAQLKLEGTKVHDNISMLRKTIKDRKKEKKKHAIGIARREKEVEKSIARRQAKRTMESNRVKENRI